MNNKISDNRCIFRFNKDIYCKEAILNTLYRLLEKCYFELNINNKNEYELVIDIKEIGNIEVFKKEFNNELIDQQLRIDIENKYTHIRNLIIEKAFLPIKDKNI